MSRPYLLVNDGNPIWVRAYAEALRPEFDIEFLRVYAAHYYVRHLNGRLRDGWRRERVGDGVTDNWALVPGWTRWPTLSAVMVRRAFRRVAAVKGGPPAAVFHTSPWAAHALGRFPGVPEFYYAHDSFRFFDWPRAVVDASEQRLLESCRATFAVSRAIVEEFQPRTPRPVIYSPTAVSHSFLARLPDASLPTPTDLGDLPRPLVGCIGQINRTYDWDLIEQLAGQLPTATFAFVGPLVPEPPDVQARIERALAVPNVRWLGAKPHAELPAYLQHFDILFNPLAVTEHNDTRSPLRLYDYLATDKPIISTAIRGAYEHGDLIRVGRDAAAFAAHVRRMLAGDDPVDLPARRRYIEANTWRARGEQLLAVLSASEQAA